MAGGLYPFRGNSLLDTLDKVRTCQPPELARLDPSLPAWFTAIVHRLLSRDPQKRPSSAAEVAQLLEQSLPQDNVARQPAQAKKPTRVTAWLSYAPILLVLAVGTALAIWHRNPAPSDTPVEKQPPRVTTPAIMVGFTIDGQATVHKSLAEAIAVAKDGDTIEVHGRRPVSLDAADRRGEKADHSSGGRSPAEVLRREPGARCRARLARYGLRSAAGGAGNSLVPGVVARDDRSRHAGPLDCLHARPTDRRPLPHRRRSAQWLHRRLVSGGADPQLSLCGPGRAGGLWRAEPGRELTIDSCVFETRFGINLLMVDCSRYSTLASMSHGTWDGIYTLRSSDRWA